MRVQQVQANTREEKEKRDLTGEESVKIMSGTGALLHKKTKRKCLFSHSAEKHA